MIVKITPEPICTERLTLSSNTLLIIMIVRMYTTKNNMDPNNGFFDLISISALSLLDHFGTLRLVE